MNDSLITFSGWVGSRVELARVGEGDGVPVASFRVGSTPRRLRDGRWENGETVWYAVKAWRSLATHVAASLRTGEPVLVTGRLVAETWQKEDGSQVTRHVVVAQGVGHDLARGTSTFTRTAPPVAPGEPRTVPATGVHRQDEDGGEQVQEPSAA